MTTQLPGISPHHSPISTTTGNIRRIKCPVHHGSNLSVAVGYINGRPWAKCWSHGCASKDILAALGIVNDSAYPYIPPSSAPQPVTPTVIGVSPTLTPLETITPTPIVSKGFGPTPNPLPPVTPAQGRAYLDGIPLNRKEWIQYQRHDGLLGWHSRQGSERRNPGVKGNGWQLRAWHPADPSSAPGIALAEGEKDAALLAQAGLIAFCAPRGAWSLGKANFDELVDLVKDTGLPLILAGDNDEPGRLAMRKVRDLLLGRHVQSTDTVKYAPAKGSIADLGAEGLQALVGLLVKNRDANWQKPIRSRAMYQQFKCPRPKRRKKIAGDSETVRSFIPCGNTATCRPCCDWENFLHVERCWMGKPEQLVVVGGFGGADSTIPETTGLAKVYREQLQDRIREKPAVHQKTIENPSGERRGFICALAIGDDNYRAKISLFFSVPLSPETITKERRRAGRGGLTFTVKDYPTRADIEDASPKSLTINMEGVGMTTKTNTWTSSGWPSWWEPETTYAFSDGVELAEGADFPADAIEAKDWKRENNQKWDCKESVTHNLIMREDHAHHNAQVWVTNCFGLNLETLWAIAAGGDVESLILEIGDYQGPTALLRDTAAYMAGRAIGRGVRHSGQCWTW